MSDIKKAIYLREFIFQRLTTETIINALLKNKKRKIIKRTQPSNLLNDKNIIFMEILKTDVTKEDIELALLRTVSEEIENIVDIKEILDELEISLEDARKLINSSKGYVFFKLKKSLISNQKNTVYVLESH